MGWLLTEMAPVVMWAGITGAMGLESLLLVSYLSLLGVDDQMLALLPMLGFGGMMLSLAVVHLQRNLHLGNMQRHAFWACLTGRSLWFGTILWPLLGFAFEWEPWIIWGGVLGIIAIAQAAIWTGGSSFTSWTQAVVPLRQRGHFFAWRNTVSFLTLSLAMGLTGLLLPEGGQHEDPEGTFRVLMWIFAGTTMLAVLATWPLLWSPSVPETAVEKEARTRQPILTVLREHPSLRRFLCYGLLFSASGAIFLTYMARYLVEIFVGEDLITLWQGLAQIPFMLFGIWIAGWLLPRRGGARLLGFFTFLLMAAQAGFLWLSAANSWWLMPVLFATWGLARSSQRLIAYGRMQEVIQAGDARQPSLYFGAMGLGAMLGSLVVMLVVPYLEAALADGHLSHPVSWYIMLGAVVVGGLATLVALLPQPAFEPYDPEEGIRLEQAERNQ